MATVLLDCGIVPMTEPETRLILEAAGGLVEVVAQCERFAPEAGCAVDVIRRRAPGIYEARAGHLPEHLAGICSDIRPTIQEMIEHHAPRRRALGRTR